MLAFLTSKQRLVRFYRSKMICLVENAVTGSTSWGQTIVYLSSQQFMIRLQLGWKDRPTLGDALPSTSVLYRAWQEECGIRAETSLQFSRFQQIKQAP